MGDQSSLVVLIGVQVSGAIFLAIAVWRGGDDEPPRASGGEDPGGGLHPPSSPKRPRTPSGTRLPLPDATPAQIRIRDHTRRLADGHRPDRRALPRHHPSRRPVRR
jgi:hypothetical protein